MQIRSLTYLHTSVQHTMIIRYRFQTELSITNLKFCSENSLLKNNWHFFLLALTTVQRLHIRHDREHFPRRQHQGRAVTLGAPPSSPWACAGRPWWRLPAGGSAVRAGPQLRGPRGVVIWARCPLWRVRRVRRRSRGNRGTWG